ncbi:MAG: methyltransferase domain-containing protein, partial [bacterium]
SNPVEVLNEVYRILAPGGLLVIEVPNIMCSDAKFFGSSWLGWDLPFHVCHWTPASLEKVLTNIGFVIEHWKFKIPRFSDFITNLKKTRFDGQNISIIKAICHFLKVWLLGHLGFTLQSYGHFMTAYARKPN